MLKIIVSLSLVAPLFSTFLLYCTKSKEQSTSENVNAQSQSQSLEVGEPFPNIVLPSLEDGRPLSLVQFRGQKIILHIFASW